MKKSTKKFLQKALLMLIAGLVEILVAVVIKLITG